MEEVLLPIGSIIKCRPKDEEDIQDWMIIGKRAINPDTMKAWDYVSVPYPDGYIRSKSGYPNFFYFNHFEIDEIVMVAEEIETQEYMASCNNKDCPICNHEEEKNE